jgi:OmpA-OmpF porin, OOP family
MKKFVVFASLLVLSLLVQGQILKKIGDKVKQKTENKVDEKVNKKVDKTIGEGTGDNTKNEQGASDKDANAPVFAASIKTYSKYDFVPGEKIMVFEDFMQDAVGDFPAKWNTNASGEIMTIEGKPGHWFAMGKAGFYMPEFIETLPDDFTFEYDMLVDQTAHSWGIFTSFAELQDPNQPQNWQSAPNRFSLNILPGTSDGGSSSYDRRKNGVGEAATTTKITQFENGTRPVHVAFWRQKERMRVYLNEEKVWDVPKAVQVGAKLNSLIFWIQNIGDWHYLLTNLRVAVGAADTRKKILEQKKWVTHGILFDVNSATIKPESYGTLKEMATVLKENPDLKIKIVGHTDADGNDASNLDLSKQRAASVKAELAKEFGIDESRMETDGKGETEPIDKNDTPAGKANNRRVEFIKV